MRRRRRHQVQQTSRSPLILLALVLVIPVLAVINVVLSAQVAHLGFRISEVDATKGQLMDEAQKLEQQIYENSALTEVYQQAEVMGFTNDTEYHSIERNLPVAYTDKEL